MSPPRPAGRGVAGLAAGKPGAALALVSGAGLGGTTWAGVGVGATTALGIAVVTAGGGGALAAAVPLVDGSTARVTKNAVTPMVLSTATPSPKKSGARERGGVYGGSCGVSATGARVLLLSWGWPGAGV